MVDINRLEILKANFNALLKRKVGFLYEFGYFLKNIEDYAFRKMDSREFELMHYPEWRYQRDGPFKQPGVMELGYIIVGVQNQIFSQNDLHEIKKLLSQMRMSNPTPKEKPGENLLEKSNTLQAISKKYPQYQTYINNKFESSIHEDHDCHTMYLVSSSIHPQDGSGYWQKLTHKGGHSIMKIVREILDNR